MKDGRMGIIEEQFVEFICDYRTRLSSHKNLVSQHKVIIEDHIHGLEGHNRLDQPSRFWSECSLDRTIATTSSIYYNSYSSTQVTFHR